MKYQAPYGVSNPDAPYINGDPTIARQGSIPPAAQMEYPQREIVNVITKSFLNPTDADLMQMTKGIRSQRMNYSEDSGGVNAMVVAYDPPIGAYTLGLILHVRVRNRVTGPSTINAGAGTVNVIRGDGSILQDGDLPANCIAGLIFDGTSFQVMNFFGAGGGTGGVTTYVTKLPYVVDTGTVPGQIIAPFAPAFTTLVAGDAMLIKLNQTSPGLTTIRVNALPPKAVLASDGSQCMQGDYVVGDVKLFVYDGTQFYIQPNPLVTANVTMSVPSQYATFNAAMNALQRKIISKNAQVKILIASGQITGPLVISHVSGSQIVVAGTMIGSPPGAADFVPGNPNQNIAMLRTRYGTEIDTNGIGVYNAGPGAPIVQDLLIVATGGGVIGVGLDLAYPQIGECINCQNVAAWGCNAGFYGHGVARLVNCSATAGNIGFGAINGGSIHSSGCHAISNSYHGYMAQSHSEFIGSNASCTNNGGNGVYSGDGSYVGLNNMTIIQNGGVDCLAAAGSLIGGGGNSGIGSTSPALNTEGNMSSMVTN